MYVSVLLVIFTDDAIHVGLPSKLTDVGAFSYSSLCGVSLLQLFDDDWNRYLYIYCTKRLFTNS